jgi:hypothetical protein
MEKTDSTVPGESGRGALVQSLVKTMECDGASYKMKSARPPLLRSALSKARTSATGIPSSHSE